MLAIRPTHGPAASGCQLPSTPLAPISSLIRQRARFDDCATASARATPSRLAPPRIPAPTSPDDPVVRSCWLCPPPSRGPCIACSLQGICERKKFKHAGPPHQLNRVAPRATMWRLQALGRGVPAPRSLIRECGELLGLDARVLRAAGGAGNQAPVDVVGGGRLATHPAPSLRFWSSSPVGSIGSILWL